MASRVHTAPADLGSALVRHAETVAGEAARLATLRDRIGTPHDLTFGQWLQLYALTLDFAPDLVLDLGRGAGNATCVLTDAVNRLEHGRVVSVGLDFEPLWLAQTVPRLEKHVPPAWFDRLEVIERNIFELDLERVLGDSRRVFVFWDINGETYGRFLVAELLPQLKDRVHLVAIHDVSDSRYEWTERSYTRRDGLPTYWHGDLSSPFGEWPVLHDFLSRNRVLYESARGSIEAFRRRDSARAAEAERILVAAEAGAALTDGHWISFSLPLGELHFPPFERPRGAVGTDARVPYPTEGHHPVFGLFRRWEGWVEAGWDVNWLGVQGRTSFYSLYSVPEERRYIFAPALPFDEEYFEWIDLLEAVVAARGEFTMVELGAGWGRWIVNAAAAVNQYSGLPYTLIAVEAEPDHFRFLQRHVADNGLDMRSVKLVRAAAAPVDGTAVFEVGDATDYYGQALLSTTERPRTPLEWLRRRFQKEEPAPDNAGRVRAVSLETLLKGIEYVDLVDADIQGAEADVFEAARDVLARKVKRVHIETHDPEGDSRLRALFEELGWRNVWSFPTASDSETPFGVIHFEGGVQSWINPAL